MDNALRRGDGAILLAVRSEGSTITFQVVPEGGGLAPEVSSDPWQPFSRDPGARSGSGFGLGLAVVRAIATSHGGTVRIYREPTPAGPERTVAEATLPATAGASSTEADHRSAALSADPSSA